MRFSYIDSQGKEIEVDSVESLALRIELGAIKSDTRLYDAVADRWAPAEEHPVFRSLSRGEQVTEADVVHIGQEEGDGAAGEKADTAEQADAPEADTGEDDSGERPTELDASGAEAEAAAPSDESGSDDELGLDFQVTLTGDEEEGEGAEEEAGVPEDEPGAVGAPAAADGGVDEEAPEGEEEDDDFFGGLDTLELADEPEEAEEEPTPADPSSPGGDLPPVEAEPSDGPAPPPEPAPGEAEAEPEEEEELPSWAAEGEALWEDDGADDTPAGGGRDAGGGRARREGGEAPPSPAPEDRMPEWAAEESEAAPAEPAPTETPTEERRQRETPAAPRPAHWEERSRARERRRRLVRIAGGALLVLAAGATAAFVLELGPFEQTVESVEGPVRPVLSTELRSVTTEVGSAAYDDVVDEFRAEWSNRDLPERPPAEWLEGIYLSTAGDFPGVRSYWESVRGAVDDLRSRESGLFEERLDERLARRTGEADGDDGEQTVGALTPAEASRVREAAIFDFRATAPDRAGVYASVLHVAESSLELHALLVEREADIAYEPYSDPGVSRDPVLEAVPADSLLRVEMNESLDRVLEAVAAGGLPRPITTSSLGDHLFGELQEVGVVMTTPPPSGGEGAP